TRVPSPHSFPPRRSSDLRRTQRCSRPRCSPPNTPRFVTRSTPSASGRPKTWPTTMIPASDARTMSTVGILGGGQLARMLALEGAPLGVRFLGMDAVADACAGQFAPMVVGDYTDQVALAEFASRIDVATFDFENVPAESARWLTERVAVYPNPRALGTAQDRL